MRKQRPHLRDSADGGRALRAALREVSVALSRVSPATVEVAAADSMKCELLFTLVGHRSGIHPLAEKIVNDLHRLQHDLAAAGDHHAAN